MKRRSNMNLIWSTYRRIRTGILRAVPWSFMVSRITTGVIQIIIPYFIYVFFMERNVTDTFYAYAGGADYMTYVVLGSALNVLAVSTLMNIGRALITELREGTLEMLLLSPSPRGPYFAGRCWNLQRYWWWAPAAEQSLEEYLRFLHCLLSRLPFLDSFAWGFCFRGSCCIPEIHISRKIPCLYP